MALARQDQRPLLSAFAAAGVCRAAGNHHVSAGERLGVNVLDGVACVDLHGKGRKQRAVPLWCSTVLQIKA